MQRLHYTGESFFVADEVSSALLDYASALADVGRSDVVKIPIVDEAGEATEAEMLIGPASQLYSNHVEHMRDERDGSAVVADLRGRAAKVRAEET
jgi:hypothetical protein